MNKITFFRFSNSSSSFCKNTKAGQIQDKRSLTKHKNYIDKYPDMIFKELNEKELKIIEDFNDVKKVFLTGRMTTLPEDEINSTEDYYNENLFIVKSKKNVTIKKIEDYYLKEHNQVKLDKLHELLFQNNYNNSFEMHNELKEKVGNGDLHDRIEIQDLNEINEIIQKMNNDGWSVKQIEGIQSGQHQISYGGINHGGGGYGFGFTEGIIIVWEK